MTERPHPKRGEVWWVKPGKTAGAELQKKRDGQQRELEQYLGSLSVG